MSEPRQRRVLAIDDDEMALTIMRKMLEAEGLTVDVCFQAQVALDSLAKRPYDAIFCDMWMPGMTGSEFYQAVRERFPEYRGRIIFVTGDIASEATWDFIDERRLPYLLKPFAIAELRRKLEEVIGEWKKAEEQPQPDVNRRKHRRVSMKASIRIRKKKWATGGPDIGAVVNASKEGVYFLTDQDYRVGTDVWVAFPYTGGVTEMEQDGFIVRVEKRAEGKKGVAVALGEAAVKTRTELMGSEEDRRRRKILAMADMTQQVPMLDVIAEDVVDSAELKARIATEREQTRRLAEELADLKATYEGVGQQRDRLAAEEIHLNVKLAELTAAKSAMTEVIDDLKKQMEELHTQLSAGEELRYKATHDSLTSTWNRAAILDILKRELSRARREGSPIGIVVADLDHFKSVNDTYGHAAGDVVLQQAAQRMTSALRDYDAVGRYGGEEFLLVLSGCDTATTLKQAERIRECLSSQDMDTGNASLRVTASMGVATSDMSGEPEELFKAADAALYRAKRGGRNRVEMATTEEVRAASASRPAEDAKPSTVQTPK